MAPAKNGDTVQVHYTGTLEDGTEFDSSADGEPLEFTIGDGNVIAGFENAVVNMEPGQSKKVTIEPGEGYGEFHDEMVITVERGELPDDLKPTVGDRLEMRQGEHVFLVTVQEVDDDSITLDGNHPLAGKTLVFNIDLQGIS